MTIDRAPPCAGPLTPRWILSWPISAPTYQHQSSRRTPCPPWPTTFTRDGLMTSSPTVWPRSSRWVSVGSRRKVGLSPTQRVAHLPHVGTPGARTDEQPPGMSGMGIDPRHASPASPPDTHRCTATA